MNRSPNDSTNTIRETLKFTSRRPERGIGLGKSRDSERHLRIFQRVPRLCVKRNQPELIKGRREVVFRLTACDLSSNCLGSA